MYEYLIWKDECPREYINIPLSIIIFFQIKFKIVLSFKAMPLFPKRLYYLKVPPALSTLTPLISTYYINGCVAEQKELLIWCHVSLGSAAGSPIHFQFELRQII